MKTTWLRWLVCGGLGLALAGCGQTERTGMTVDGADQTARVWDESVVDPVSAAKALDADYQDNAATDAAAAAPQVAQAARPAVHQTTSHLSSLDPQDNVQPAAVQASFQEGSDDTYTEQVQPEDGEPLVHESFVDRPETVQVVKRVYVTQAPPPVVQETVVYETRPSTTAIWLPGYWRFSPVIHSYVWVSGCWRIPPVGMIWQPGIHVTVSGGWAWVPGYWAPTGITLTYAPIAPPPLQVEVVNYDLCPGPGYVWAPGYWNWVGRRYDWIAGHWIIGRPGHVYVHPRHRWTPRGYAFSPGYFDRPLRDRGVAYRPVVVDNPRTVTRIQPRRTWEIDALKTRLEQARRVTRSGAQPIHAGNPKLARTPINRENGLNRTITPKTALAAPVSAKHGAAVPRKDDKVIRKPAEPRTKLTPLAAVKPKVSEPRAAQTPDRPSVGPRPTAGGLAPKDERHGRDGRATPEQPGNRDGGRTVIRKPPALAERPAAHAPKPAAPKPPAAQIQRKPAPEQVTRPLPPMPKAGPPRTVAPPAQRAKPEAIERPKAPTVRPANRPAIVKPSVPAARPAERPAIVKPSSPPAPRQESMVAPKMPSRPPVISKPPTHTTPRAAPVIQAAGPRVEPEKNRSSADNGKDRRAADKDPRRAIRR